MVVLRLFRANSLGCSFLRTTRYGSSSGIRRLPERIYLQKYTTRGEIMEWNERVEDANSKESLESLKKDIDIILQNLYKNVSKAFKENNINQAKLLLSKAKYFSTLIEKINEIDTT